MPVAHARKWAASFWHQWMNGGRYKIIGAALGGGVAVLVAVAVAAWAAAPPPPFDPLPVSETQTVKSRVFGVDGPAVLAGDDVKVSGRRCNNSDATIQVRGNLTWQSVLPRGSTMGEQVFAPGPLIVGCTSFNFSNPMPPVVVERIEALSRQGIDHSVWRIAGDATPIDPDTGEPGVTRHYTTDNFTIVAP